MDLRSHSQQQSQSTVGIPEASSSLKLGRRPSFQFKETKEQTRSRLSHDLEIEDWVDAEGGIGAILRYPDRVGVKVPAAIWDNWKPANYLGGAEFMRYRLSILWYLWSDSARKIVQIGRAHV